MLEFDQIETPENVVLERRLAGIGSRLIAGTLDFLILFACFFVLFIVVWIGIGSLENLFEGAGVAVLAILIVLAFLIYWGYFVFFEYTWNGQTPGKRRMRIRVVKDEGRPITFLDVAIRNLLRVVDGLGLYFVAGLVMFVTSKVQRLGDLAAGTLVVSEQPVNYAARGRQLVQVNEAEAPVPAAATASGITPEQRRVLTNYWQRRTQLSPAARDALLQRVVLPILVEARLLRPGAPTLMVRTMLNELMTGRAPGSPPVPRPAPVPPLPLPPDGPPPLARPAEPSEEILPPPPPGAWS